jgi:hypothetical protein
MSKDKTLEKVFIKNENLDEKNVSSIPPFFSKKKLDE